MIKQQTVCKWILSVLSVLPLSGHSGTMDEVVCPANRSASHTDSLPKEKRYLNDVLSSSVFKVNASLPGEIDTDGVGTATLVHIDENRTATFVTAGHIFEGLLEGFQYSISLAKSRTSSAELIGGTPKIIFHNDYKLDEEGYKNELDIALIKVENFPFDVPVIPLNFKFDDIDVDGSLHLMGYREGGRFPMLISNIATKQNSGLQYSSEHIYDGQSGSLLVSDFGIGYGVQSGYAGDIDSSEEVYQKIKIVPLYEAIDFLMGELSLSGYKKIREKIVDKDMTYSDWSNHDDYDDYANYIQLLLNKVLTNQLAQCSQYNCLDDRVGLWKVNNLIRNDWESAQTLSYLISSNVNRAISKIDKIENYINYLSYKKSGGSINNYERPIVELEEVVDIIKNILLLAGRTHNNRAIFQGMIGCTLNKEESDKYLAFSRLWEFLITEIEGLVNTDSSLSQSPIVYASNHNISNPSAIDNIINRQKKHLAHIIRKHVRTRQLGDTENVVIRNAKKIESMIGIARKLGSPRRSNQQSDKAQLRASCNRIEFDFQNTMENFLRTNKLRYLDTDIKFNKWVNELKSDLYSKEVTSSKSEQLKNGIKKCLDDSFKKAFNTWQSVPAR